jgi:hypothetical protein
MTMPRFIGCFVPGALQAVNLGAEAAASGQEFSRDCATGRFLRRGGKISGNFPMILSLALSSCQTRKKTDALVNFTQ